MSEKAKTVRVAVVQAAPVVFDLEKTLEKALGLIKEAAQKGANIVVFPETFIPGYPRGLTFGFNIGARTMEGRKDFQRFHDNCVAVPGPEVDILAKAAAENNVYLAMGITEKDGKTLTVLFTAVCCFSALTEHSSDVTESLNPQARKDIYGVRTTEAHLQSLTLLTARWAPSSAGKTICLWQEQPCIRRA